MLLSFLTSLLLDFTSARVYCNKLKAAGKLKAEFNTCRNKVADSFSRKHRSETLSRQAQSTKGMKQSRFHQLQLIETALPRRKNIIVHHINLHFLCMSIDLSATDPSRLM